MKPARHRPFHPIFFAGLALLAVANVARVVLERHTSMPEDPRDAIVGVVFGLAFGCLIMGMWKARRVSSE
jgi:hypothetical protein